VKLIRAHGPHPALIFIGPALDVVLILVFFVILSTSFLLQPGVSVTLPDSPFLLAPQREPQIVSITAAPLAGIYFESGQVSRDGLREKLAAQRGSKRTVIIKADRQAAFEQVASVVAIALELGFPVVMATGEES